jgi:hypothetical protein
MIAEGEGAKKGQVEGRRPGLAGPASVTYCVGLLLEIYAHVEAVVVPVCFVFSAPVPVLVHAGNILIDLTAMLAVSCGIAINSCAIGLKSSAAIRGWIAEGDMAS